MNMRAKGYADWRDINRLFAIVCCILGFIMCLLSANWVGAAWASVAALNAIQVRMLRKTIAEIIGGK